MKKVMSIVDVWAQNRKLSGEFEQIIPAFCHTLYGEYSGLFAPSYFKQGGILST